MKVKCRIALAVDKEGHWNASGFRKSDGTEASWDEFDYIIDTLCSGERRYWVEVEVDAPDNDVETIRAEAKPVEEVDRG